MRAISEIIAWKLDNAPGMRTREGADGSMEIFDWPPTLGPMPTAADLTQWDADMSAAGIQEGPEPGVDEILEALIEQVPAPPGSKLADVKSRRGPR